NLTLISGGTVVGLVTLSGQPVTNAEVRVIANNGTFTTATGLDGRYTFFPVEPGPVNVQAMDPLSSFRGFNSGTLNNSGNTLTLDMQLFASGTITGVVYRTDGVTPIPNAPVSISGSTFRSTIAGAQGQYSFDVVPLGAFTVTGSNPANNEANSASGTLSANLQTLAVNIVMRPNIVIGNRSVVERNVGTSNATFNVTLSSPSLQEVRVNFATANNSAVVGDYLSSSGTVIFAPGVTSQPVNVAVVGDVAIEPTENFVVNLSSPVNGTITDSQGLGTIMNDDGFAGQVDHFAWGSIPSVQFINESFPVSVMAQDAFNNLVTDFAGPVTLTGVIAAQDLTVGNGNTLWNFPLASFYHDARLQSIYLSGELGQGRTITGLALDVAGLPGQTLNSFTIRIKHTTSTSYGPSPSWESAGWTTVLQTNVTVSATGWLVLPFAVPFNYNGADNLMVDFSFNNNFYSGDGSTRSTDTALNRSLFFRTDSGSGDPASWSGTSPTPGVIARVPNIRLLGSEASVVMTPSVSGTFTNGLWSGNVTVQQLATNLVLRANDGDGHLGNSLPVDVLVHNDLSLTMVDSPDPVQVGGVLTYTLTVTNTGPLSATGVIVSNILPATATFVSAIPSQGTASNSAGIVRCDLGTIPGAGSVVITIVATPTAIGNITNRASITRGEADPFPANDSTEAVTTVLVPSLTIADVSAPEGNSTNTAPVLAFEVRLSYPNSQTVTVNYATTNGTALTSSDFAPTNGVLTFLPGETNKNVRVRVIGDTLVEPNETFFVNLSTPVNATLADNQGVGTIVNDDGLPGQIDHFDWASIASPQYANEPFPVTIMAKDGAGITVSNFTGPVTLAAFTGSSISNRILGDLGGASTGNSGPYTMGYSFTPNTNLTVTHVRHFFGNRISIWTDNGVLLASQNVISTPGTWVETPLAAPLALTAGVRYRVSAYTEANYYYRFDAGFTFSNGVINTSYQQQGDGYPNFSDGVRWWFVDLRYNVGNQVPISVNPAISGTFTNGVWSGNVAVDTLSTNASLAAMDGDGHAGRSTNFIVLFRDDVAITVTDSSDPVGSGAGLA
ncbi:MAG: DUF11 domain-containing protein, partial [Akkermansiaceae bacterium]|nr:DUF11 domain-containing protein [Verrucomicrobiales bacterium]